MIKNKTVPVMTKKLINGCKNKKLNSKKYRFISSKFKVNLMSAPKSILDKLRDTCLSVYKGKIE
jgi:hypothetical protein